MSAVHFNGSLCLICGEMAERLKATVSKTVVPAMVPGVQIPLSPPYFHRVDFHALTTSGAARPSSKTYADSNSVSYAYNSATGDLTGVSYSDSTPAVTIAYSRLGQKTTVTDAVGSRSFFGYLRRQIRLRQRRNRQKDEHGQERNMLTP